jgi:hypothetical protein
MSKHDARNRVHEIRHRGMRCMQAIALAWVCLAAPEASAQVCCPIGCVQNNGACVVNGSQQSCSTVPCNPPSGKGSGSSSGGTGTGGGVGVSPPLIPGFTPICVEQEPTQAIVDARTNSCVATLVANAQFVGCLFEDAAGKAEDKRTGLSCPARQAALARQCRARCATFAKDLSRQTCITDEFLNGRWFVAFGDLGGQVFGSANVAGCGPRLMTKLSPSEKAHTTPTPFK